MSRVDLAQNVATSDAILLVVKPQDMAAVLLEIRGPQQACHTYHFFCCR